MSTTTGVRPHNVSCSYLFLQLLSRKHCQLVPEYLLRVEHLLVVHLLDEGVVLDAVGLQELHVGDLEGLPDGLGDELSLQEKKSID